MKFIDKYRYSEAFGAYCDNIDYETFRDTPERLSRSLVTAITWMVSTPEGKQLVRELCEEVGEADAEGKE